MLPEATPAFPVGRQGSGLHREGSSTDREVSSIDRTVIEGLLLVLAGVGLVVAMVVALRSDRIRHRAYKANAGLRSLSRVRPADPETLARQFEAGIYVGMCVGAVVALVGVLVAVS